MRTLLLLTLLSLFSMSVFSQNLDKLTLKNKTIIKCTVTEVTKLLVFYSVEDENGISAKKQVAFKDVVLLETENKFIADKYEQLKADASIPASEEYKKAAKLLVIGGVTVIAGVAVIAMERINVAHRGQIRATGQAMVVAGIGLGVYGFVKLKEAKEKQ